MRTLRLSLVGPVILMLSVTLGGTALAQSETPGETEAVSEVVWELLIPSRALPEDFVKLVIEDWTLAPGADTTGSFAAVLGNEALRGRGLLIESGELRITPATDAMLWRGGAGDPETPPAGETVILAVGDAIFLPAIADDEVDREVPIVIANPGTEAVMARSFHTHQNGGAFFGFPPGLTLGDWDMAAGFDPATREAMNGVDVTFRLTRTTAEPGMAIPIAGAPALGLYLVEDGALEQMTKGPGGEFVYEWPTGKNGLLPGTAEVERTLHVVGDHDATVLEFAAFPQGSVSE